MGNRPTITDHSSPFARRRAKPQAESANAALGAEIRALRTAHGLTAAELAERAQLSPGMMSRIERGGVSPSIDSLQRIAGALHVPIGRLFANVERREDFSLVRAGQGIIVKRYAAKGDQRYELLGNLLSGHLFLEPYLITIDAPLKEKAAFQHTGVEFIHVLEGAMIYRYGADSQVLGVGDSMLFDCNGIHGPQEAIRLPIRYLSVLVNIRT